MATVRRSVSVRASAEKAWESVLDFESRPMYEPRFSAVTYLDGKPLRVGSQISLTIDNNRFTPVVETLEPPKRLVLSAKEPGFRVLHSCEVATSGEGSRVAMSVTYEGLLGAVLSRLKKKSIRKDLLRELSAIKYGAEWTEK